MRSYESWTDFISRDNGKDLFNFLRECASSIYARQQSRQLLSLVGIDIENFNKDEIIDDLAAALWIYLQDTLEESSYYAELYKNKDISRLVYCIVTNYKKYLLDQARTGNTFNAYYRTCREALSKSKRITCRNIVNPSRKNSLPLGMCFAPSTHVDAPEADKLLFQSYEYRIIPAPPGLFQKNIRRAQNIEEAAIFFWHQAAEIKGKHFFLIRDFVNYIRVYFDIYCPDSAKKTSSSVHSQSITDQEPGIVDPEIPDIRSDNVLRVKNLLKHLKHCLSNQDLDILEYRMNGNDRKKTMERFALTDYAYKQIRNRIKDSLDDFYEGY